MRNMRRQTRRSRLWGARGATMVEYSLVVAFLVVGSILAIDYLNGEASDEVANQADCVATLAAWRKSPRR